MLTINATVPTVVTVPANGRGAVSVSCTAVDNDLLLAEGAVLLKIDWGDATPIYTAGPTPGGVTVSNIQHSYPQGIYFVTITASNFRAPVPDVLEDVYPVTLVGPASKPALPAPIIIGPILPRDSGSPNAQQWNFDTGQDLGLLESDLKLLLTTSFNERLMQPSFGTNLHALIFGNDPRALAALVQSEIQTAVAAWEPRVSLVSANATQVGNQITVAATFKSLLNQQLVSTSITFSS